MHWRNNQPEESSIVRTLAKRAIRIRPLSDMSLATRFPKTTDILVSDLDGSGRAYNSRDCQELSNFRETSEINTGGDSDDSDDSVPSLHHVEMPHMVPGLASFGYHRVLRNRITEQMISDGASYDIIKYKPTLIHDVFMLPGSLANLLGKGSSEDLVKKMTPGLLAGFHRHVQPNTLRPCVLKSSKAHDYVQGIVVFGLGRESRGLLHKHYQPFAKRKTVEMVVEIAVPARGNSGALELKRRAVAVHAFLWRNKREHFEPERDGETWNLGDYLAGNLGPSQTLLRVEPSMKGDEDNDGYIGRDVLEYEVEQEQRETVYGGAGSLQYDRAATFTGW
ncbi:hypothetical protein DOTSEDRAFT_51059 [Dothistroma septosporum NZE10]|uniref:Uncharacterized protein n=1 Tax=Dothistroma septosporum (strain NZE10 / CBS 128990) TaxID=675120 RepID=N1PW42_DOTSN|nr:hypothetical protein DOTSEDRAFT_51059 [Dothistroma septosporum NZE10]